MGKGWDNLGGGQTDQEWHLIWLTEAFRILKPGAPIRIFSATRTYHRVVQAMRLAGFEEISLKAWCYSSGFPKSTNLSKQIDRKAGKKGKVVGHKRGVGGDNLNDIVKGRTVRKTTDQGGKGVGAYGTGAKQVAVDVPIIEPATKMAKRWKKYGTALKPAWEPVVCGRKPL